MAMHSRKRDFTQGTLEGIKNNLEGEQAPYNELTKWWSTYGEYFDFADPSAEIEYLERHMSCLREIMSCQAPAQLDKISAEISQIDAEYAEKVAELKDELLGYGKVVDVLIDTIASPNFEANFNKWQLLANMDKAAPALAAKTAEKRNFIQNTTLQFGFDKETAEVMWRVWVATKIEYPNALPKELDWYYSRALSQFAYSADKWTAGAGQVYRDKLLDDEKQDARNYFVDTLGLTDAEFNRIWYMVRLQSQIDGGGALSLEDISRSDDITQTSYYNQYTSAMGINPEDLTFDQFLEKYEVLYSNMQSKADFAHMMYTLAGNCISEKEHGVKASYFGLWHSNEGRRAYIGWLGDATWAGLKDALWGGGKISFGNGDYQADLDADNIATRMRNEDIPYMQASSEYYAEIKNNLGLRATEFEENHGYENIEAQVIKKANCESLEDLKEKYPEAFDFLMSVKNGDANITDYTP